MTKDQKIAKLGKVILRASVTEVTVSGEASSIRFMITPDGFTTGLTCSE